MEYLANGTVRYRLYFGGNPTLNSHDFASVRVYEVGDTSEIEASRALIRRTVLQGTG